MNEVGFWIAIVGVSTACVVLVFRMLQRPRIPPRRDDRAAAIARSRRPPRGQHHAFSHVVLRDHVLEDPESAWDDLTAHDALEELLVLWRDAGDHEGEKVSPVGLRVDIQGDIGVALVTVPPPARVGEAYMIAVVRAVGAYFVLERGEAGAELVEWRRGVRVSLGTLKQPSKAELLVRLGDELPRRRNSSVFPGTVDASDETMPTIQPGPMPPLPMPEEPNPVPHPHTPGAPEPTEPIPDAPEPVELPK